MAVAQPQGLRGMETVVEKPRFSCFKDTCRNQAIASLTYSQGSRNHPLTSYPSLRHNCCAGGFPITVKAGSRESAFLEQAEECKYLRLNNLRLIVGARWYTLRRQLA